MMKSCHANTDSPMGDAGLLQAVLDSPDEEALRLRYADWLATNGQPDRAELIRVQIQMTRLEATLTPNDSDGPPAEWTRLSSRAIELIRAHKEWLAELPELPGVSLSGPYWGFSGGF